MELSPAGPAAHPAGPPSEDPAPPESPSSSETLAELADLVQRASKRIRRETFHRLAPIGLTPGQGRALSALAHVLEAEGREMRLNELAENLRIAPRSATTVVDALEAAGLVLRVRDPEDRRATLLRLAPEGHRAVEHLGEVRREVAAEYFAPVPEEQRAVLLRALRAADASYTPPPDGRGHGGHGGHGHAHHGGADSAS